MGLNWLTGDGVVYPYDVYDAVVVLIDFALVLTVVLLDGEEMFFVTGGGVRRSKSLA